MGNKHAVMTVFAISLLMKVEHEKDHAQCFHCECKWNSSPKPLSVCPRGATCKQGPTPSVCVKYLTPTKTPKPIPHLPNAQSAQRERGFYLKILVSFFLAETQGKRWRCLVCMDNVRKNYQQRSFSPSAAFFSGETFLKTNRVDSSMLLLVCKPLRGSGLKIWPDKMGDKNE